MTKNNLKVVKPDNKKQQEFKEKSILLAELVLSINLLNLISFIG